jgi:two-component system, chemotaxis family, chemotaxis protein CheY
MTVLIVDDSRMIRQLLSFALQELGVSELLEAESADKALCMLKFCPDVDLILTDWHMPGMSGLEFVTTLRASDRFATVPIIMSTSESHGDNVVAALRAGVSNYVIKPFDRMQLADKVGPYIRAGRPTSAASSSNLPGVSQSGVLKPGDLANVLQFFIQSRKTGCCELLGGTLRASIFYDGGKVIAAQADSAGGDEAFFQCFQIQFSRYVFHDQNDTLVPENCRIQRSTPALLLEAVARIDVRIH